jgi:predicted phage tail protein
MKAIDNFRESISGTNKATTIKHLEETFPVLLYCSVEDIPTKVLLDIVNDAYKSQKGEYLKLMLGEYDSFSVGEGFMDMVRKINAESDGKAYESSIMKEKEEKEKKINSLFMMDLSILDKSGKVDALRLKKLDELTAVLRK